MSQKSIEFSVSHEFKSISKSDLFCANKSKLRVRANSPDSILRLIKMDGIPSPALTGREQQHGALAP